ncbi:MFS transporter [Aetokthonos hydrillicola Thurmond2011]|jgi:MFS family permease|uniref:MFS transporter n=1 Tax=Aetokthonos hydrillicola Thurmond2011 TaxID=2712845 RepID=A0AAP5I1Q0_9CYAN|nr:MFS transporter [Aetokthonos hydrillicola]MBO3460497.1 MFS transporter [Aetokthonos hydrillicola CCALA 1050]MBW4588215.1 MFS transporter [Aetokthonos hydrillicola CCALA 1050]MDR9893101.1 MFS transporter [Aetokthonos hydrillicola Thurmond2011]
MKIWNRQSGKRISNLIENYLPAFRWRNFRLFFGGQLLSMSGTFMTQQLTIPWLVYDLTKSAWLLGVAGFVQFLPTLLVIPCSGILSDRWSRRDLLMVVQILGISVSLALTILTFTNWITFPILLVLSALNGLLKGLDVPVRHTIVTETVDDRADWSNAIALNSVMLSSSLVLGPAIGGILIATLGVKYCFLYDTISYIPAIFSLLAMRLPARRMQALTNLRDALQKLGEGYKYITTFQAIRAILLVLTVQGLVGMSHISLMPVFAAKILNGDATTMAHLSTSAPIGSLFACVYLSFRRGIAGLERLIVAAQILVGMSQISFSLSRQVELSIIILVFTGCFTILLVTSSNMIIQNLVAEDKRGRVMSFYALAMVGTMPFGNLFAGTLADHFGATNALIVSGSLSMLGALWFCAQLPEVSRCTHRHLYK